MGMTGIRVTWRETGAARWAISVPTFVLIALGGAAAVAGNQPGTVGAWAVIVAWSTVALGAVFALAQAALVRRRPFRPVGVGMVVIIGAAAGAARGAAVVGSSHVLGEDLARTWPVVIATSVVLVCASTIGVALVIGQAVRYHRQRVVLRARLAALREEEREQGDLTVAITDAVYDEMVATLDETRRGLDRYRGEVTPADRVALSDHLRETVDRTLRPLSHRLMAAARQSADDASHRGIQWTALRALPVLPLPTAIVVVLVTVPMALSPLSPLGLGAATWLVLTIVVRAARRWVWADHHAFPLAAVSLALALSICAPVLRGVLWDQDGWALVPFAAMVAAAVLTIVGAVGAVFRGDELLNERLRQEVSAREVDALVTNRDIARASRDLAGYVHGRLQSRLLATAFAIDQAVAQGDEAAYRRALHDAQVALAPDRGPRIVYRDLAAELDAVASVWRGFVDVSVRTDPGLPVLPVAVVGDIGRIAEESVANARKHGHARTAVIEVVAAGGDVRVRVTDDGLGPRGGMPGMGLGLIESVAPGAWTLRPGPGGAGAELDVALPMTPPVGILPGVGA